MPEDCARTIDPALVTQVLLFSEISKSAGGTIVMLSVKFAPETVNV